MSMSYSTAFFELSQLKIKDVRLRKILNTALLEKQERDNPKPLTLEDLKQRNGKPVWIEFLLDKEKSEWKLFDGITSMCVLFRNEYSLFHDGYGKTWLAYDHEPQEADCHV